LSRWVAQLRRRGSRSLRWSVVVSSPKGAAGEQWGDTWFGRDLVAALQERGQQARLVHHAAATSPARDQDDVVLVLRGLKAVVPRATPGARTKWLLWVISHPDDVHEAEVEPYDAVFAASAHWSRAASLGRPVIPLLQATNPHRFRPDAAAPDTGASVLFVGSTRGQFRPIVRDAIACGASLSVFGVGWQDIIPEQCYQGQFLPNPDLPAAYAAAGVVLNDHWPDMAAQGFLSNRLFDAVACGARVVSDQAVGLAEVFGSGVRTYSSDNPVNDLRPLVSGDFHSHFPERQDRLALAARIAADHSFLARVDVLIEVARDL